MTNSIPDPLVVEEVELLVAHATLSDNVGLLSGKTIRWEITGTSSASFTRGTGADGISTLAVYFDMPGSYNVTPYFDGETDFTPAVGPTLPVTVFANLVPTTTAVNVPATVVLGASVVVEAIVGAAGSPLDGAPVNLYIDDVLVQDQKLTVGGRASWTVSFTSVGTHTVRIETSEFYTLGTSVIPQ